MKEYFINFNVPLMIGVQLMASSYHQSNVYLAMAMFLTSVLILGGIRK